ncbi:hypothetical protein L873DRAFT_731257 [Choiromyces venosus 120613-1]|uniref:Uncharacterized protein n=1 Tax=Choiromyces venosus 120613-1 TaxID=1336337 RepID=A0A3N4JRV9_9PEZI|nr:hypothetical protein L873DRAFT_731257 [Choiromyces venosus 120613-1]
MPSLVTYQFPFQPKNINQQRKTYIQAPFRLFLTCPHFSPPVHTSPGPPQGPDNNPQTLLITTISSGMFQQKQHLRHHSLPPFIKYYLTYVPISDFPAGDILSLDFASSVLQCSIHHGALILSVSDQLEFCLLFFVDSTLT